MNNLFDPGDDTYSDAYDDTSSLEEVPTTRGTDPPKKKRVRAKTVIVKKKIGIMSMEVPPYEGIITIEDAANLNSIDDLISATIGNSTTTGEPIEITLIEPDQFSFIISDSSELPPASTTSTNITFTFSEESNIQSFSQSDVPYSRIDE